MTKAIILAAGRGRRMGELTDDRPKGLMSLQGLSLIARQITNFQAVGIRDIAIVTGYRAECLEFDVTYFHNSRWDATNMVRSLMEAQAWLRTDNCIISYADVAYDRTLLTELIFDSSPHLLLPYTTHWRALWEQRFAQPLQDLETFRISSTGTLLEIGERPTSYHDIEGQFMGVFHLTPLHWRAISGVLETIAPYDLDRLDITSMLRLMLAQGQILRVLPFDNFWVEVDTAHDLHIAQRWARQWEMASK